MNKPAQFAIPATSAGFTPLRRPGSIRRTTTIQTHWPNGGDQPRVMRGDARDLYTAGDGTASVVNEAWFDLSVSPEREILALAAHPDVSQTRALVGVRAGAPGRSSRAIIAEAVGHLAGEPLFQLLDDYSGSSLVSGWGWLRWVDATGEARPEEFGRGVVMKNICIGHAEGASSLNPDGSSNHGIQVIVPVGPFVNPADPQGWHTMTDPPGAGHRRARRIDLWREGDAIRVDSWFQDSAPLPDGRRIAVHEYAVDARIAADGTILDLTADALILPFMECPGSVTQVHRLIGKPAADLRTAVSIDLAGPLGCTHLNDVLRALADVPALAEHLPAGTPG